MQRHLSSLLDRVAPTVRQTAAAAKRWRGITSERALRYARATHRTAKRWTFKLLGPVEAVLLNAASRERVHATATFALIFLFAIASVDFLISGGPEFGVPERAERRVTYVQVAAPREAAAPRTDPVATEVAPEMADATAANVTALTQTFDAPARRTAQPAVANTPDADNASLAGETPAPAEAAEPARPRKHERTKPATEQAATPDAA